MNLLQLIRPLAGEGLLHESAAAGRTRDWSRIHITHVTGDAADVIPGSVFVATNPRHRQIRQALARGASALVGDPRQAFGNLLPAVEAAKPAIVHVRDVGRSLALLERSFYGRPSDQMEVVGITGTNGKTMTTFMINAILEECGKKTGFLSSVSNKIGRIAIPAYGAAEPAAPQPALRAMKERGTEIAVVEFSSQSLAQGTGSGLSLDIAILTNIAVEHLAFHRNLENYLLAKARLFTALKPAGVILYNADDPVATRLSSLASANPAGQPGSNLSRAISFGIEQDAHLQALDIQSSCHGSLFRIRTAPGLFALDGSLIPAQELAVRLKIPGRHQIYNALAASATGLLLGLPAAGIARALEKFPGVKRRFELIFDGSFRVIDDCAKNPGSIQVSLMESSRLARRLVVVHALSANEGVKASQRNSRAFAALAPLLPLHRLIICGRVAGREKDVFMAELAERGVNASFFDELPDALSLAIAEAGEGDLLLFTGGQGMDGGAKIFAEKLAVNPQLSYEEPFEEFDSGPLTLPLAAGLPPAPFVPLDPLAGP